MSIKKQLLTLILLISFTTLLGCEKYKAKTLSKVQSENQKQRLRYDLENPDEIHKLHYDLEEVSGLSYFDINTIACVQDELGRLYINNLSDRKIDHNIKFGKSGDYEGVEIVGERAYVVKNNGNIFEFKFSLKNDEAKKVESYKTPLNHKNDVEGLGHLADRNMLLLACKGKGEINDDKEVKGKAIYGFDLEKKKLKKKPLFTIRNKQIEKYFEEHSDQFYIDKSPKFNPSAVAEHPITKDIYVLSSNRPMLVILNKEGDFKDMAILSKKLFRQPEGLTFAPNGDMFISNEGDGSRGNINVFKYLPEE